MQKRKTGFQISYVTITYRSVFFAILGVAALVLLVMYFVFPDASNRAMTSGQASLNKLLAKVGLSGGGSAGPEPGPQQAHFTNIDGNVRVKKASTNTWIQADYSLALEKNDVVQTSPEGMAKVVFTDGSNFTVKPDSLIVIQEHSLNSAQQTQVTVHVTTGMVDLDTGTISPGSRSQVTVEGANVNLDSQSSAEIKNDPNADQHAVLMQKGTGEVTRGDEKAKIGANEMLSFTNDLSEKMAKSKVIAPPILINPAAQQQVTLSPGEKGVTFSWTPVESVKAYRLSLAHNQFFNAASLVYDKTVTGEQIALTIPEGVYFWKVQSVGEDGKLSAESPLSKFSLTPRGNSAVSVPLEVAEFVQHGHMIEVRGRTEPGARVMVNGQEAIVMGDGTFRHLTNSLPTGENMITVTALNSKGGVNSIPRSVTIQ